MSTRKGRIIGGGFVNTTKLFVITQGNISHFTRERKIAQEGWMVLSKPENN